MPLKGAFVYRQFVRKSFCAGVGGCEGCVGVGVRRCVGVGVRGSGCGCEGVWVWVRGRVGVRRCVDV